MTDIVNAQVPISTDELVALKVATGKDTTKAALRDAVEYRIKHGGKKA